MLCIVCNFENILIAPLVRVAGLAADMHILLGDLFLSAPSGKKLQKAFLCLFQILVLIIEGNSF